MQTNNTIINFLFETGDSSCPWWSETIIVQNVDLHELHQIENKTKEINDKHIYDDLDYHEIVEEIMNELPYQWHDFNAPVTINGSYIIYT